MALEQGGLSSKFSCFGQEAKSSKIRHNPSLGVSRALMHLDLTEVAVRRGFMFTVLARLRGSDIGVTSCLLSCVEFPFEPILSTAHHLIDCSCASVQCLR